MSSRKRVTGLMLTLGIAATTAVAAQTAGLTPKRAHLQGGVAAQTARPAVEPPIGRLIVKLRDDASTAVAGTRPARIQAMEKSTGIGMTPLRELGSGATLVALKAPMSLGEARAAAARLARDPAVEYAEPDIRMRRAAVPTEPRFQQWQWNLFAPTSLYTGSLLSRPTVSKAAVATGGANLPPAWDVTTGSASVVVAVIDTGIVNHPDLNGIAVPAPYVPVGRFVAGYDFVSSDVGSSSGVPRNFVANDGDGWDPDPTDPGDWITAEDLSRYRAFCDDGSGEPQDSSWHGTHVAGVLAATANNDVGIAGTAWNVRVQPVRALGRCGGSLSDIAEAIRWSAGLPLAGVPANATPARVINLSLGGDSACSNEMQGAVDAARAAGAVVVAATGNEGQLGLISPANCRGVIAVTAHAINGENSDYANVGTSDLQSPQPTLSAPGGGSPTTLGAGSTIDDPDWTGYYVWSAVLFGDRGPESFDTATPPRTGPAYAGFTGTSVAAPQVAGVAALIKSIRPDLNAAQIGDYIAGTVRPYPAGSVCAPPGALAGQCGTGLLDADRAVRAVANGGPVAPPVGGGGGGGGGALPLGQLLLLAALLLATRVRRRE